MIDTAWMVEGACVDKDPHLFYGHDNGLLRQARAICNNCPVKSECREYALAHEAYGTWAGLSERQRDAIRKSRGIRLQSPSLRASRK